MENSLTFPTAALSIRQPWCHHILCDGKDVENRTWKTNYRGPVLIHASKTTDDQEFCRIHGAPLGGIVGIMDIVDCVTAMDSRWFFGPYGFVLRNPLPLEFVACRGKLGFFKPDIDPAALRLKDGGHEHAFSACGVTSES